MFLFAIFILLLVVFSLLNPQKKFRFRWARGCLILFLFVGLGMVLTWKQNIENNPYWFGKTYQQGCRLLLTLKETPEEKARSFKALATVTAVFVNNKWVPSKGEVLVYFKKNEALPRLEYGSQLISSKDLQEIQNSGNPAALNYRRYCLFQGITHQVFLSGNEYIVTNGKQVDAFQKFLFSTRDAALRTMQKNIHSRKELGIAEALLIGYRNDLDKDLVQAYSNTGVVHIIAISGLHIGVIYALLLALFNIFKPSPFKKWLQPIIILSVIWMFTLLAGAAPSISRAAVMFSCILTGKLLERHSNIYNTMAVSAFMLLAWNPFYLWDVGFQLSYAAVLSIIIFFNPLHKLIFIRNRALRWVWKLSAVTLSAQIFTLPLVIYHFHQFPVLFLLTNFVAVPLSSLILFGELFLFCVAWWPAVAAFTGNFIESVTRWMNDFIGQINKLPFSVWDGLHVLTWQLVLLYTCFIAGSTWVFYKKRSAFITALLFLVCFCMLYDVNKLYRNQQQKLVIYNVPKHNAMDFIAGDKCLFAGDSTVLTDAFLRNFNIKPSRIKYGVYRHDDKMLPPIENLILQFGSEKIVILNKPLYDPGITSTKIPVDIVILCDNAMLSIELVSKIFEMKQVVAAGSNTQRKCLQWKKECEQLHLRFHSVNTNGAFLLNM